jgi:uncharacterized protein DUF6636
MAGSAVAATGFAVGVLLVVAACGGAKSGKTTVVTEKNVVTVTAAATTTSSAPHDYARFRMPSKNVGCIYNAGVLRCDILSGLIPEPSEPCELDWTGFVLKDTRGAQPECAGDTVYDEGSPVLEYGERWSKGGITCESRPTGLRCENGAGAGFTLARGASSSF